MGFQGLKRVIGWFKPPAPHPVAEVDDDLRQAFDADFYLGQFPGAGLAGSDPLLHYLEAGWREGRDPTPWFSTSAYLAAYADVREAGINPLVHYLRYGRWEGRSVGVRQLPDAPEKPAADPADEASCSAAEAARIAAVIAPEFDAGFYLAVNPDVAEAGLDPVLHYVTAGWAEGRDPAPGFSTSYYLETNPDIRAGGLNPFWHFVVAGREENRLPVEPGGYKAQILKDLVPLEETVRNWCKAPCDSAPADLREMTEGLKRALRRGSGRLIISFTHDDYSNNVGGVQLCVLREEQAALAAGHCYMSLRPRQPLPRLAEPEGAEDLVAEITLNGEPLGAAPMAQIVAAAGRARGAKTAVSLAVHSLLGAMRPRRLQPPPGHWSRPTPGSGCTTTSRSAEAMRCCATGSPSAAAPEPGSQACGICVYGEERSRHLPRMRRLFEDVPFSVVAPSEAERTLWMARSGIEADVRVQPHLALDWTGARRRSGAEREGPVRVAFAGVASAVKGWPAFRRLAEANEGMEGVTFHYFGVDDPGAPAIAARHVAVTPESRAAMRDALIDAGIDLFLLWSACPETFSLVAYEALAAGAAIVTHAGTGNVAALVRETGRGRVLESEDQLHAFFASGEARALAMGNRLTAERGASLILGRMTIDLIEEGTRADGDSLLHKLHV